MLNMNYNHGGYKKLKSFKIAQLIYDLTVQFCDLYIDKFSRTRDQMTQAARSGVQNIAEGSMASATAKKTELMLTQVARASLEELKLDYSDFLRQRGMIALEFDHPIMLRFKKQKAASIEDVYAWLASEVSANELDQNLNEQKMTACLMANAMLSLINVTCYFLSRQVQKLADDFVENGDFSELLSRLRAARRKMQKNQKE